MAQSCEPSGWAEVSRRLLSRPNLHYAGAQSLWALVRIKIEVRLVHFRRFTLKPCNHETLKPVVLMIAISLTIIASAQDHAMGTAKPVTMMTGLGDLHHLVATKNAQAQEFFDQGLRLIYAFNHDEAARSFQKAAELDPKLAIAYWGIAEAVGPNYNDPASEDSFKQAHEAIQKAVDLSGNASDAERGYIFSMAKRFPADPKADRRKAAEDYRDAMREVVKNNPDDLDAATLFAESGMDLHPWDCGIVTGRPRPARRRLSRLWNR